MAIFKNREVTIVGPNTQISQPTTIGVSYQDGTYENVPLAGVRFTQDEKDTLVKANPSVYDNVDVIKEDDLKAVRVGVAPSFDEDAKRNAETEAFRQRQLDEAKKRNEDLRKEADKNLDQKLNRPATPNPTSPSPLKSK